MTTKNLTEAEWIRQQSIDEERLRGRDIEKSGPRATRAELLNVMDDAKKNHDATKELRELQQKVSKIMRMGRPMKLKNGKVSMDMKGGFLLTPEEMLKLSREKISVDVTKTEVVFAQWKPWT
jgi:hypothetical protein